MRLSFANRVPKNQPLALFVFENESSICGLPQQKSLIEKARAEGFKGKEYTSVLLHLSSSALPQRILLVGLGDRKKIGLEVLRRASSVAAKKFLAIQQKSFSIKLPEVIEDASREARAAGEGILLSNYRFHKYKTQEKDSPIIQATLIAPGKSSSESKKGMRLAQVLSDATLFVRDLVNEPPSNMTPEKIAEAAMEIAQEAKNSGISVTIFDKKKIEEMGMGALLGVNRGSAKPPVFIHLHYQPSPSSPASPAGGSPLEGEEKRVKSVALVGKGITFDAGGLSLKTAEGMETMKMDMAGAASILGVFKAIPKLKPKVEVHGIIAATENMPGGNAYKPGDILKTMSGKTIEVLNTDAEGRLILSDALAYALQQNPDEIIDIATLTMAVVIALGSLIAGAIGNSNEIFKGIERASEESGEKFWRLPLESDYKERLKSPIADIRNIATPRREAGATIGALVLEEFVGKKPWMHLDIAGPAWAEKEFFYLSEGGTGFPTRTLLHYLLNLS